MCSQGVRTRLYLFAEADHQITWSVSVRRHQKTRGACDWFFWKRKSPLLSVRLGLFSSKKLFCLFHSASRRENEKSYKDGGHGTRIFSGNSVK